MAGSDDQPRPGVELVPRRSERAAALVPAPAAHRDDRLGGYTLEEVQQIGNLASAAGMLKVRDANGERSLSPPEAFFKVLAGFELGLPIVQALSGIDFFDGQIQMRAKLMAQLIKRSGKYRYEETPEKPWTDEQCSLDWYERVDGEWRLIGTSSFSVEEAKAAKLIDNPRKQAWGPYRKSMLFNRALAQGARAHAPDAVGGATYLPEELEPVDDLTPAERDYEAHAEKTNRTVRQADAPPPPKYDDPIDVVPEPPATPAPAEAGSAPESPVEPVSAPPARQADPSSPPDGGSAATPTESFLEILGSNQAEPGWRPITKAQQTHLREIAAPLDSEGLGRVLAWLTRDDGPGATRDPAQLREPRYQELKHVLENAPKGHPDRAALVKAVVAWEESTSSQGRDASLEAGPAAGDAPTDPDGQGRLA